MKTSIYKGVLGTLALSCTLLLVACSGGGASGSVSTSGPKTAASIILDTTVKPSEVKSDNSDSIEVVAYVVDTNKAPVADVTVSFSAGTGQLNASSGKSDQNGKVTINFSAGPTDNSNRIEVVKATVPGTSIASQISIKVSGSSSIAMSTSNSSVKSDNSTSATISAVILDANQQKVSGAVVTFACGTGKLGVSSGKSDANGLVTIPFSAGTTDYTNRTEVITATVAGTSTTAQIPIKVVGSTMSVSSSSNTIQAGSSIYLKATVKDASSANLPNQTVRFSIPEGNGRLSGGTVGTGTAISQTVKSGGCGTSDKECGITSKISFTPTISGSVEVTADWLDAAGNVSLSTKLPIKVTAAGVAFAITDPSDTQKTMQLGATQTFSVGVPSSISYDETTNMIVDGEVKEVTTTVQKTVAAVRFSTSLGKWSIGGCNSKSCSTQVSGNAVNGVFSSESSSGIANIQIDAVGSDGATLATLYRTLTLSAAAASAKVITLQAGESNVPVSKDGTSNSTTLTATVRTSDGGSVVKGAVVLFEIMNPTGSGENIYPPIATTDSNGQAKTTFTSGSQTTVGGIKIKASLPDKSDASSCDNSTTHAPGSCDVKSIFVNGSGVSISLGYANKLTSVNADSNYSLAMSVLVVDNAGAAVKDTKVSLSVFPVLYYKGTRDSETCDPAYAEGYPKINEDINENENLDAGEDTNGDGTVTPAHATAGTVPSTVTTDENGAASFNYIYQKIYATWIQTRVRAKVVVPSGTTESTNEVKFILPFSLQDIKPCTLSPSPVGW